MRGKFVNTFQLEILYKHATRWVPSCVCLLGPVFVHYSLNVLHSTAINQN